MASAVFDRRGLLAISPSAIGMAFEAPSYSAEQSGPVAVVEIIGPIVHHRDPCFDSYDAIKDRVKAALSGNAKCVLLSIDSPGGLVDGCFDCVTEIRKMADDARKPLFTYVDAHSESAGYALATAGQKIFIPKAGSVGSIGVVSVSADITAADAAIGIRFSVITSGARKADGNPHIPLTEAAQVADQLRVNAIAAQFFSLVAERRGLSVDAIRGFEAGLFIGSSAIDVGLADEIATFDETLALLSAEGDAGMVPEASNKGVSPEKEVHMEKLIESLRAIADDEKAPTEERDKARKMLAAYDDKQEPDGDEEPNDKAEGGAAPAGEPDDDEPKEEPKKDAKAQASTPSVIELAREVQALRAQVAKRDAEDAKKREHAEKQSLIATRPDLAESARKALLDQPLATVQALLPTFPVAAIGQVGAARAAIGAKSNTAQPTSTFASSLSPEEARALDVRMGLAVPEKPIKNEGTTLSLGVMTPEQSRAFRAKESVK